MWHTHSAAAAAAATLTAAAHTPITIDHQYLGGAARWRHQEVDATVIRWKSAAHLHLAKQSHTSFSEVARALAQEKLTEKRGPAHTVACR
jgi:hypothetical protein